MTFADRSNKRARGFTAAAITWLLVCGTVGGALLVKSLGSERIPTRHRPASVHAARYHSRNIEDLKVGDLVMSRDQKDPQGPLVPRRVENVFARVSDHLRVLLIRGRDGETQVIKTTDNHPFWLQGRGWTVAGELKAGDSLHSPQGADAELLQTYREEHAEGIAVYNFRVDEAHTYFVSAENSTGPPVWVHNADSSYLAGISVGGKPLPGYGPVTLDLSKPNWTNALRGKSGRGVYILSDAKTGQILKPGETGNIIERATGYAGLQNVTGRNLRLTYYETPGLAKIERTPLEKNLRIRLESEGEQLWWDNTLSRISSEFSLEWKGLSDWLHRYPNW